jgi:hypothetical protein
MGIRPQFCISLCKLTDLAICVCHSTVAKDLDLLEYGPATQHHMSENWNLHSENRFEVQLLPKPEAPKNKRQVVCLTTLSVARIM